ncbi:MAG: hypothetical protein N2D54_12090 [Chloroflexota bacterium]
MKLKLFWKKSKDSNELGILENQLDILFLPVAPQIEFVQGLRNELVGDSKKHKLTLSPSKMRNGLIWVGGVASVFIMVMAGLRAIITLLGAVGIVQQINKQNQSTAEAPLRIA